VFGAAAKTAGKLSPWARALAVAQLALVARRHLYYLQPAERTELRELVTKSKGRRSNLTADERRRFGELVRKLEPGVFAKHAATTAMPFRRRR
jgi:hypothetical protein